MGDQGDTRGRSGRPRVVAAARQRHWVLSTPELRALGLSERQVRHAVATGMLHRVHHGVYAVGRPELSFEGRCHAAVLACGPGSAVGHASAARLWGVRAWYGPIHVAAPRGRRGHPGLIVHRPRSLPDADVVLRHGLRVTTVARTLLDMAADSPVGEIGRWLHEAHVQRVLDRRAVLEVCRRHPHHRGRPRLEQALALEVLPTRSGLEEAFLDLCRRAGVRTPVVNARLWSGERAEEADFHWPDRRLIVETDGARYHGTRWRRRRDAAKDERFRAQGWVVWRIGELELTLAAREVGEELRRLAGTGR